jgi:ribosomal protein S6--L-glutamate ligase
METLHPAPIALENRIKQCRHVRTLGVKPNFNDYTPDEQALIRQAPKIYYPSIFYADLLDAMGKATFPSYHTYKFAQDKIKQTAMFALAGIPHPRTRVFYGRRQMEMIPEMFAYPFIAKTPRGSALGRGVYLIRNQQELSDYRQGRKVAYIQEYLPVRRDMRIVVVGKRVVHAYWRIAPDGDFRSNVAGGGRVDLRPVPDDARKLALTTAQTCGWDDVGLDICQYLGRHYVLEANMKYGRQGFHAVGIDYDQLIGQMITDGEI